MQFLHIFRFDFLQRCTFLSVPQPQMPQQLFAAGNSINT